MVRTSLIFLVGLLLTAAPLLAPDKVRSAKEALGCGAGAPFCLAVGIVAVLLAATNLLAPRKKLAVWTGVAGATSLLLSLVVARINGGHCLSTELGLLAGVIGLVTPALLAAFKLGRDAI